jgi:hypothetical protein
MSSVMPPQSFDRAQLARETRMQRHMLAMRAQQLAHAVRRFAKRAGASSAVRVDNRDTSSFLFPRETESPAEGQAMSGKRRP